MAELERLGKYTIRSVLGKGAMGVVYLGHDPFIDRAVAIKTIRSDALDPEVAAQYMIRFRNEARAAGRLTHANIVGIYDYGEEGGIAYIVMEYVEGSGLREYLARQAALDFGRLVTLMTQLLDALQFAHSCGIVHRDIKPSNLIVTREGILKIADFGVAHVDMSNLTQTGMVIGTPSYMSPEQCAGRPVDARSDVFSAGVVLYELLTGQRPFAGTLESIAYKICHEDPVPPSRVPGQRWPAPVDDLLAKALAKRAEDRFSSARAFRDALLDVAQGDATVDNRNAKTVMSVGAMAVQVSAARWDDETLGTAERQLAEFLGPMARVVVRRAAARTQDRGELCALLSESIEDPDTRRRFIAAFERSSPGLQSDAARRTGPATHVTANAAASTSAPNRTSVQTAMPATGGTQAVDALVDDACIEEITARLAVHLGPIARVIAKRAAQTTSRREAFVRQVAGNLGAEERTAFLQALGYREK